MKPRLQLVLGMLNSMAAALAILAMAPVYLHYLGAEAYGLIGFYATLLLCMQMFDMGMATTVNREIARNSSGRLSQDNVQLLRSVEWVYVAISAVLILGMWLAGGWLAQVWFTAKNISTLDMTYALYGIAVSVALRLPVNVYHGALFGAQKMHLVSAIGIAQILTAALGAYVLLRLYKADIVVFFMWQALVSLLYLVCMRAVVWRLATERTQGSQGHTPLRGLWRYTMGAGLVSIAGLALSQVDKIILSKTLDLEHYGYYMLASSLASCMYMVAGPFYNVFFPVVSKLMAHKQSDGLLAKYQFYSASLACCVFPVALYLVLFFPQLVGLWIQNPQAVAQISPIASLLVMATALHAMMHLPHALMMAYGVGKTYLAMYVALIVVSLPVTAFLSIHYGAKGGAWGQIILFVIYAIAGTWITHRYCLKGYALHWLFKDLGRPLGVVALFAVVAYLLGLDALSSFSALGAAASIMGLLGVCGVCAWVGPSTRGFLVFTAKSFISKRAGKFS